MRAPALATLGLLASISLAFVACADSELSVGEASVQNAAGSSSSTAGSGGAAGEAGAAGMSGSATVVGKGDVEVFPKTCVKTCEEACSKLETCGADLSDDYPIVKTDCLSRCALSEKGPVWDDISANFKCCASQSACGAVKQCGGFLKDPSTTASCKKLCTCFFASAGVEEGKTGAPKGYVIAERALAVVPHGGASLALPDDVTPRPFGKVTMLTAARALGDDEGAAIASGARTLPTFRDGAGGLAYATGKVFVRAETAKARAKASSIAKVRTPHAPVSLTWSRGLHAIEHDDAWQALRTVEDLRAEGLAAELDLVREYKKRGVPSDPKFVDQWHLRADGQKGVAKGVDVRASEAWDLTTGSPDVIISIHDDGVDLDHPDIAPNLVGTPINWPENWQQLRDTGMFGGHGTSCTGVAAAKGNNGEGVSGACPDCAILPALLGLTMTNGSFQVSDEDIAKHFKDITDAGAAVISNSWGLQTGDARFEESSFPTPDIAMVTADALDYAETKGRGGKGTLVVFAAGNDNSPLDSTSAYKTVVAVGAIASDGVKAYYSNHGPELDIAAPSNGGLAGITTTSVKVGGSSGYTDQFGGTSSACPLVAGVLGLIVSANPDLTAKQVRDILQATATKIDPAHAAYDANGLSEWYGAGMVNAFAAVKMAKGMCKTAAECAAPSDACPGCKKAACAPCRTNAECTSGLCQAVPGLGETVCVDKPTAGNCPADTKPSGDACIPSHKACGTCAAEDVACNGQDDDCTGVVDDGAGTCSGNGYCPTGGTDCSDGKICAGSGCTPKCNNDADCGEGIDCKPVKDRYGKSDKTVKGCAPSTANGCKVGCEVLAGSLPADKTQEFIDCMKDGKASCGAAQSCAIKLPVKF